MLVSADGVLHEAALTGRNGSLEPPPELAVGGADNMTVSWQMAVRAHLGRGSGVV